MIALDAGGWSITIDPTLGGAILSAQHHDRDVLRPAPTGCRDPLQTGCFPLVPYANRIAEGRFDFAGETYRLPRNFGDHPHSLHGVGWQVPWRVVAQADDAAVLRLDHAADADWPWDFRAQHRIAIRHGLIEVALTLTNAGARAMPAGVGLHPYFPANGETRLRFVAAGMWLIDDAPLPTVRTDAANWSAGARVARDDLIDNAFDGWDGSATLTDAAGTTTITADASTLHLYVPPGAGFACVEPVSHLPDAINRGGMPTLAPGATRAIRMRIARRQSAMT